MDTSLVYGYNEMMFTIENTLNRSLGVSSPTKFDAGGFDYDQLVFNFSGVREVAVGGFHSPLNIAPGIEARLENYSITAVEPDSWRHGGVLLNGAPTASGAQVFPGFRPEKANPKGLVHRLDWERSYKTPWEAEQVAAANAKAARGYRAIEKAFRAGASEMELHHAYLTAIGDVEEALPYTSIVALDDRSATLHYHGKRGALPSPSKVCSTAIRSATSPILRR